MNHSKSLPRAKSGRNQGLTAAWARRWRCNYATGVLKTVTAFTRAGATVMRQA